MYIYTRPGICAHEKGCNKVESISLYMARGNTLRYLGILLIKLIYEFIVLSANARRCRVACNLLLQTERDMNILHVFLLYRTLLYIAFFLLLLPPSSSSYFSSLCTHMYIYIHFFLLNTCAYVLLYCFYVTHFLLAP